ncbi:hypothetical protein GIB67_038818 [Kingdonia uniflora]|uniref:Carboxypeptidase n=1 Tax=Kingdonia uniflora TaxID=39325 RepID=A0A7J7M0R2_9MAGN|nr:hypothetical protein GIB67_038818 [Kingdonia uniflora]
MFSNGSNVATPTNGVNNWGRIRGIMLGIIRFSILMLRGPGYSSELAIFYENGPFNIANNLALVWNEYGWTSFSSDNRDLRHNEDRVSNDLYDFLQAFFTEHPQYAKNDFYIMGESYAGHYIPAFAARVHRGNKAKEGIHINLKAYYALEMGIIQQSEYKNVNKMLPACELATKLCGNSRWVHAMEWSGHKQFVGSPTVPFVVDGAKAGQMKSYGSLSFLKTTNHITNTDFYDNKQVHDAGHMVPMDQPKATLEMLKRWTKGKLVENTETEDVVTNM